MSSAGRTRQRITINRPTTALDDFNGAGVSYATAGTYWAEIERMSGSRSLNQEETNFRRPYIVTVRQYADILEDDTITFNGETLIIQSIEKDVARKRYLRIVATESYEG